MFLGLKILYLSYNEFINDLAKVVFPTPNSPFKR